MTIDVEVVVRQQRPILPTLLAVGFGLWVLGWLWWVLAGLALAVIVWWGYQQALKAGAEQRRLREDADRQHQQVLRGDPQGWYGRHQPADIA